MAADVRKPTLNHTGHLKSKFNYKIYGICRYVSTLLATENATERCWMTRKLNMSFEATKNTKLVFIFFSPLDVTILYSFPVIEGILGLQVYFQKF